MPDQDLDRAARLAQLDRQIAAVGPDGRPGPTVGDDTPAAESAVLTGLNRSPDHLKARDLCLRKLAATAQPRARLEAALRRQDIPEDVATEVLDRLTEHGLIDDEEYARAYVRTKHQQRGLGRSALRQELRRLGVDAELIGGAVDQLDDSDERQRAQELVAKRLPAAMAAGPEAGRRRLMGFLARRGYSSEVASSTIRAAVQEWEQSDSGCE